MRPKTWPGSKNPAPPSTWPWTPSPGVTVGPPTPDAQAVHALLVAGLQAVRSRAEQIGYDRLADFLKTDPEYQAWVDSRRRARAQRRGPEWEVA